MQASDEELMSRLQGGEEAALDCSAKAVENRLYRARRQLRMTLGPGQSNAPV
jgi:hypothetical protein